MLIFRSWDQLWVEIGLNLSFKKTLDCQIILIGFNFDNQSLDGLMIGFN